MKRRADVLLSTRSPTFLPLNFVFDRLPKMLERMLPLPCGSVLSSLDNRIDQLSEFSDLQILQKSKALKHAASQMSESEVDASALALACEAMRRQYGMTPYDVQKRASLSLGKRLIVEMATGEGKTLTAVLALFIKAIKFRQVFLATANDYLAERDAEFGAPVLERLGLSNGLVVDSCEDVDRRVAYQQPVVYGTASQFGFDFLRDRAKRRFNERYPGREPQSPVMSGPLSSIIVDEADSLLIDEATTPLVISSSSPKIPESKLAAYNWASELAKFASEPQHYKYKKIDNKVELNEGGRQLIYRNLPRDTAASRLGVVDLIEFLERAILVLHYFELDRNYLIAGGEIQLVDQSTGRVGKGRQWSEGIHQAIQAKEGIDITMPNGVLARVTLQNFLLSFEHLSGMTGTASQSKVEFRKIYELGIQQIPTRKPNIRQEYSDRALETVEQWLEAIAIECEFIVSQNRSVLIGTRNIWQSEKIADDLRRRGMDIQLLNARQDSNEAEIVSQAGQAGRITVATNMAGRGTDIELSPEVRDAGGLHVILAGIHESKRIDRQLIGRAARQGDPGSYRRILCFEDQLIEEAFDTTTANDLRDKIRAGFTEQKCLQLFFLAQQTISQQNVTNRAVLFHQEKKNLKPLYMVGMDPLLDCPA